MNAKAAVDMLRKKTCQVAETGRLSVCPAQCYAATLITVIVQIDEIYRRRKAAAAAALSEQRKMQQQVGASIRSFGIVVHLEVSPLVYFEFTGASHT